jgi:hypothetical protein
MRIAPHVDAWTLCKIMGWASLSVAMRYIHPSDGRALAAFTNRELIEGGDKTGDSKQNGANDLAANLPLIAAPTIMSDPRHR